MRRPVLSRLIVSGAIMAAAALPVTAAKAQEQANRDYALATPEADQANQPADANLPKPDADFWSSLNFDPNTLVADTPGKNLPAKPAHKAPGKYSDALAMKRTDNLDGSASVNITKPLPMNWDTKIGADLNYNASPYDVYGPSRPYTPVTTDQGSAAAWANMALPEIGSLDARLEPGDVQRKVGATIKRSVPVGRFSITVQDSESVTDTFTKPAATAAPMPTATIVPQTAPRVWGNEKLVKLDVLPTGTSFSAGITNNTADPVTHNTVSADQKLYGPLHVTTSVTDFGQTTQDKRITAGLKLNW